MEKEKMKQKVSLNSDQRPKEDREKRRKEEGKEEK